MVLSRLPETEIRRERLRLPVAVGLLLPFAVWEESKPGSFARPRGVTTR
jgi:hypothetical protein